MPVRDEADIIGQSLAHLLKWADSIYVFDTGSEDETWDIVNQFASEDRRVIPLKRETVRFSDTRVRAWIFDQARSHMRNGDWFLRVDADEFHHIVPREFVESRISRHETVVYHQYYDFRLTSRDVEEWNSGREGKKDRNRPIEERRRWFTVTDYTEPRLCRYRSSMKWPAEVSFPYNAGFRAATRIPIRHYPHRDPVQLQKRCRLRARVVQYLDNPVGHHWNETDWRRHIVANNNPALRFWNPGSELPVFRFRDHLSRLPKRLVQRLVQATCLPILDRLHAAYQRGAFPDTIPSARPVLTQNYP
jgi:glycosyltransferase involved in cell wall biosynthesis